MNVLIYFLHKIGNGRKETLFNIPVNIRCFFKQIHAKEIIFNHFINTHETIFHIIDEKKRKFIHLGWPKDNDNSDEILRNVNAIINEDKFDFIFAYIADLDHLAHEHGIKSEKVFLLKEKLIRQITEIVERNSEIDLLVISDHGLADVTKTISITPILKAQGLIRGREYIDFIDSTMHRFWVPNRLQEQFRTVLTDHCNQYGSVVSADERKAYGLEFSDRRFGDIIFLANPGVTFSNNFFSVTDSMAKAFHGYSPEHPTQKGIFITKEGMHPRLGIFQITDVFKGIVKFIST